MQSCKTVFNICSLKFEQIKKMPHRNAAFVKNQSGSVTPKENEFQAVYFYLP
jgi:hypothetical protein